MAERQFDNIHPDLAHGELCQLIVRTRMEGGDDQSLFTLGPGAATVTSQCAATARASSSTRIAGPAIDSPSGSAEMNRTRVTPPVPARAA